MRKWQETIQPWKQLSVSMLYLCLVLEVTRSTKPRGIRVTIQHLGEPQAGRTHTFIIALPLRPEGLGADFFRACGLGIAVGGQVAPRDAIGVTIRVRFAPSEDGNYNPVTFKPKEENNDGRQSE